MRIGIVGAGYVGLVTAACLAHIGHDIVCLDLDAARIEGLREGRLPIREPRLDELVAEGLTNGRLAFASGLPALRGCDLAIVCVGTLDADEEWDGAIVRSAVAGLARDPSLPRAIVIRSTLLPGTSVGLASMVRDIDPDVRLAHNPEFTREAVAVADFLSPDRVVIGVDDRDEAAAAELVRKLRETYAPLAAPLVVTDLTSAELIKVASNVFLAAKVTFANEIARLAAAAGADVQAVVDGMGLDRRIGRSFLSPGPGFGGSCFPSQARALPQLARGRGVQAPLLASIWGSNEAQAAWLVEGLAIAMGDSLVGRRVALLGLTFKAGTEDLRESPALRLGRGLLARGARLVVHDPVATNAGAAVLRRSAADPAEVAVASDVLAACRGADAVVVATEWPQFSTLDWRVLADVMAGRVVVDARRIVDVGAAAAAGLRVLALGVEAPALTLVG